MRDLVNRFLTININGNDESVFGLREYINSKDAAWLQDF